MLNTTKIEIAGITPESVVDGPGIRSTVFFQGCPHACPGCHNPDTWDAGGGTELSLAELIPLLKLNPLISGVTFSGGEPFFQAVSGGMLGNYLKSLGLNLWVYTGYTWDYLVNHLDTPGFKVLVESADVIIDGPFQVDQKSFHLAFRGSANQRIIKVKESLQSGKPVYWVSPAVEIKI
jgi:anaerobic ribonucleoside-triphosphate reductase activating protein